MISLSAQDLIVEPILQRTGEPGPDADTCAGVVLQHFTAHLIGDDGDVGGEHNFREIAILCLPVALNGGALPRQLRALLAKARRGVAKLVVVVFYATV